MSNSAEPASPATARVTKRFSRVSAAEDRLLLELGKKHRILAHLGEGGTARVWLAMARGPSGFNKLVVLKTIRGELFDDPKVVGMFLKEARLAARLNHPHIVQTNEVFETASHPVIVMEYLDGLPFSAILERQREGSALALAMLLRIISDALSGLHAAHELHDYDGTPLSVVHRDVSPHNLFVTFAGQTKVLDFGIARFSTSEDATDAGVIKGKLRYISPEQVQGASIDRRADIYSMGVILWEVATASRMWSGISEAAILDRVLAGDLPRARDVDPTVDTELEDIIHRALSHRREDRYPSALEFQLELDQYLGTLGGALRNRDIGRALTKMFDDVREERRQTIEQQLARTDTLHDIQLSGAPLPELTSFSNLSAASPARPPTLRLGPRLLSSLALLMMAVFAAVLFWRPAPITVENSQNVAQASPKPKPRTPPPERTAPDTIALRITAFPRHANLVLDGKSLRNNPYSHRVSRDPNEQHRLKVEAEGFEPEEQLLTFSHDQEFVLTLEPRSKKLAGPRDTAERPSKEIESRNTARPSPAPAPTPALEQDTEREAAAAQDTEAATARDAKAAAARDTEAATAQVCETPFYFDARGIKKYRRECL